MPKLTLARKIPLIAAALFGVVALQAQTSRGTVTGVVTDATNASVPGATVDIINAQTNVKRSTTTNDEGVYRFDAVDLGTWEVVVSAAGFRTHKTPDVPVEAAQTTAVDAQMEIGEAATTVDVTVSAVALQTETPVRGGNITTRPIADLPFSSRNPALLAVTLPGVIEQRQGPGVATFSANGGRGRSNNFLLDGTENNDISVAGQAFQVRNPNAIQEVSVQTGVYDAEFGRAGGAVVNVITRSGTNELHGTLGWLADFTNDDAITNTQALNSEIRQRGRMLPGYEQFYNATLGGPVVVPRLYDGRNRTFFFTSWQEQRRRASSTATLLSLSPAGRETLRNLFPAGVNPRADAFLDVTKALDATGQFTPIALGDGRPAIEFGTAVHAWPYKYDGRQSLSRLDHRIGDNDLLSVRYGYDMFNWPNSTANFPGFQTSQLATFHNIVLTETHIFSPSLTNELRIPFNRIVYDAPLDPSNPLGSTLPFHTISGLNWFGIHGAFPQGRVANNYIIQDTMSWVKGRHTLRFGIDLLQQRSRQTAPVYTRGQFVYGAGGGYTSFANFIDDFGGSSGAASRDFGSPAYYPELFRQAYFMQDRWQIRPNATLTLGLRYENFGTPMNAFATPAYAGLFNISTTTWTGPYAEPNRVPGDNNNFAPVVGLTWSPAFRDGFLGRVFGDRKSVIRTGYNIGYDSFFNNIASNIAGSAPNLISTAFVSVVTAADPRGAANLAGQLPMAPRAVSPTDTQMLVDPNLKNPYYQRWSFGVQRELPWKMVLDASYVGSKGTGLFINEDLNPVVPAALSVLPAGFSSMTQLQAGAPYRLTPRLDPLQGSRLIRTNNGHSTYHSGQFELNKRFSDNLLFKAAYTWSKLLDNASEIFTYNSTSSTASIPSAFGGQPLERGLSLYDRTHRFVLSYSYMLPFFQAQRGFAGRLLGGWQVSGITAFESGVPYSVSNGVDSDGIGGVNRPDLNPSGRAGVRAAPNAGSPTGYVNPDAGNEPINPMDARYIGLATSAGRSGNAGRNTERIPAIRNWNANLMKTVRLTERFGVEFRSEFYNLFNTPQYGYAPGFSPFVPLEGAIAATVIGSAPGRFMRPEFLDGGGRVIRYQLTLRF